MVAACRRFSLHGVFWALLPLVFLAVMVVAPLIALSGYSDGVAAVWRDDYLRERIIWTLTQAVLTVCFTVVAGVPLAWVLARFHFLGRRWIVRLLMLPFVMPTLVAGMGVLALFGAQGMLWSGWQDTPYLLLYGNVFFNLPVLVRAAYQGFLSVPVGRLNVVKTLGAGAWQQFWAVEWPAVLPWLAGGMCLVFLYCFSGFGLALLLGGSHYATVEVEIYQLIAHELDIDTAASLVWLVLAITAAAGGLYASLAKQTAYAQSAKPMPLRRVKTRAERILLVWAVMVWIVCCVLPLLAVLIQTAFAGASWQVLMEAELYLAAWNTLRFTLMAMLAAALLGVCHAAAARRWAWVRGVIFLPFMVSPVCVAFGVLVLYPDWTASLPLLVATYALLAYPFITKDVLAAWDSLPTAYTAAARTMGATRRQAFLWVVRPLLMPAFRRGLTLAAATCVGEFAATLFLSRPEWQTLTTLIYRYLGTAGADNHDRAMVVTCILMLAAIVVFIVLDATERRDIASPNAVMEHTHAQD